MSLKSGPITVKAPDFSKYTEIEIVKFNAIFEAQASKDAAKAQALFNELTPNEEDKLQDYVSDWQQFQEYKKSTEEALAYHQNEIDEATRRIATNEGKRTEILHQHGRELRNATTTFGSTTHDQTYQVKKAKKPNTCSIL